MVVLNSNLQCISLFQHKKASKGNDEYLQSMVLYRKEEKIYPLE